MMKYEKEKIKDWEDGVGIEKVSCFSNLVHLKLGAMCGVAFSQEKMTEKIIWCI